jgi:eukaryotic-like serine/threonine-protein kinase
MPEPFAERYNILSPLGSGGMSEVYLAQDIKTGGKVALKILDKKLSKDQDYIIRFKREAEIASKLSSKNIVKLVDYGTYQNTYYKLMNT